MQNKQKYRSKLYIRITIYLFKYCNSSVSVEIVICATLTHISVFWLCGKVDKSVKSDLSTSEEYNHEEQTQYYIDLVVTIKRCLNFTLHCNVTVTTKLLGLIFYEPGIVAKSPRMF